MERPLSPPPPAIKKKWECTPTLLLLLRCKILGMWSVLLRFLAETSVNGCIRRVILHGAPAPRSCGVCGGRASVGHQAHGSSMESARMCLAFLVRVGCVCDRMRGSAPCEIRIVCVALHACVGAWKAPRSAPEVPPPLAGRGMRGGGRPEFFLI